MKKDNPEYYWERLLEKNESGDMRKVANALIKLYELAPDYKEYCNYKRLEEGGGFLGPVIDYYWWKKNIKGKYTIVTVSEELYSLSKVFRFKNLYEFDKDIFKAVCEFISTNGYAPNYIAFNRYTYNQIRYILSTSSKLKLYCGKRGESEINFDHIEIEYKLKEGNLETVSENDCELCSLKSYMIHQTDIHFDNHDNLYYTSKDKMRTILSQFSNVEGEYEYGLHIKNPFGPDYVQFDDLSSDTIECTIREDLSDMEFELTLLDVDDDDDNDDDDDEVPDLPIEGLVKKQELVLDLL